jgi:hypothetical protein
MRHRRGRALRRRYGHAKHVVPNRKDLIAALGLEPEGRTRGSKYDYTTSDYWKKVRFHDSPAARRARQHFGLPEPAILWSTDKLLAETRR